MNARAFLERRLRAWSRPSLDLALLTGAGGRYAVSRIGLIGVRALVRTAVHVVELWFLSRQFPLEFLAPLFALRTLPGLLSGLHWGALEGLRVRVRREARDSRRAGARATIEAYLLVAGVGGALLAVAVTALVTRQEDPLVGPLGLYGLFAIVTAVAVAIELWTRTYHSGVFALGRVYRPAWSLLAPDVLDVALVVLLFGAIGPFSLHVVVLASALVRGVIAIVYARRAYRSRGMLPPRVLRLRSLGTLSARDGTSALAQAAATLPLQLDRLLLLALLSAPPPAPTLLALALPYYALRPIAGFAQSWARGFYTDFVRLDALSMGVLRARFERLLARVALVCGLLSVSVFAAGACAMFGARGLEASAWLLPLALVRARFALEQVSRFAYGARAQLIAGGAALLLALLLAASLALHDRAQLLLVTGALLLSLVASALVTARGKRRATGSRLPLSAWLHVTSLHRAPIRISIARVDASVASARAVLALVARELAGTGHATRVGRAWLLWCEPLATARPRSAWARTLAGTLAELRDVAADTGSAALERARAAAVLPGELGRALAERNPADPRAELIASAARLVPVAEPIDLRTASRTLARLSAPELALVRRAVLAGAREQHHVPQQAMYQVAVYAPAGEPELVFVWPRGAAGGGELRRAVRLATWRASIATGSDHAPSRSAGAVPLTDGARR
jgi:hypothetical protein